jgi:hypothetical protein
VGRAGPVDNFRGRRLIFASLVPCGFQPANRGAR